MGEPDGAIHVVHVLHAFGTGGMERGIATVVRNASPGFRHSIVCMWRAGDSVKLLPPETTVLALEKPRGNSARFLWRLRGELRRLRPDVIHTRNWGGLDAILSAQLAGLRCIVHGEHGWDMGDPEGDNPRRLLARRWLSRLVREITCVSRNIERWLVDKVRVRIPVTQIYSGVDTDRFRPGPDGEELRAELQIPCGAPVVGILSRLDAIKDHPTLFAAFARVRERHPGAHLLVVGEGAERDRLEGLRGPGVHLLGGRVDVPRVLRAFDIFVLPSRNEGISNTILEAMATGLPVIASRVGGNPELVTEGETGSLFPAGDVGALADAILALLDDPDLRRTQGGAGRARAIERFSIASMVRGYEAVWTRVAARGR
jgi:sugar transferase (PEP-CTERM/EpsH1 system associated)